jgi:hypothetical protein
MVVALVLATAGVTYFFVQRDADARVLAVETRGATRLAECEEGSATHRIEVEGQLAECELDRLHTRCATLGDHVDEAQVTAVRGRSDIHVGDTCRYELDWNTDPMEGCRAFVRCGLVPVYGGVGQGYFECTVDEDGIVHGEDANPTNLRGEGDPYLTIDRQSAELTISDETPRWSVTLGVTTHGD